MVYTATNMERPLAEDPLSVIPAMRSRWRGFWLRRTFPFAKFGHGVWIDYSCDMARSTAREISLGDDVYLAPGAWINILPGSPSAQPKVVIGRGCKIGRCSTISARHQITLEADVLIAPAVSITDHEEMFDGMNLPGMHNPPGSGKVVIEQNCWLGYRAAIRCTGGELTIGRNSVVGANAVVTTSFPPFSVIGGNPAKLIKSFDQRTGKWIRAMGTNDGHK